MSFGVCYRNFKAFVQRYSWIDDSMTARIEMQKKCELKVWLNRHGLRQQTRA